ncbi:MAG: hypothetical protein JWN66_3155 [Sphingomonas bacterium]|jgi:hypothetical protein|uniref:hypothetical protein n=1 Tax=Sphingomonas bacterium TaxID=1895847 RepID=UPI0026139DC9|nr:hypothetical protein [Sphingomonas bacterium]MDB5706039.1 hypothetical protein [Sphingomonas bacterium]
MSVVVGEVVNEPVSERASGASGGGGSATSARDREIDLDRLDYGLARRAHRLERLWAD